MAQSIYIRTLYTNLPLALSVIAYEAIHAVHGSDMSFHVLAMMVLDSRIAPVYSLANQGSVLTQVSIFGRF